MKPNPLLLFCSSALIQCASFAAEPALNQDDSTGQQAITLVDSAGAAQSPNLQGASVFGIAHTPGTIYRLTRQRELLEASAKLATMLREIKGDGNEEAVLALLASMNEHESVAQFTAAFAGIDLLQPAAAEATRVLSVEAEESIAHIPSERKSLVPVLAQTAGEDGSEERVVVMVGERRYSRVPGESIEFDGRVVLIDAIETIVLNGNEVTTIWVMEDGKREALQWLP